jgi:hypothetical protein
MTKEDTLVDNSSAHKTTIEDSLHTDLEELQESIESLEEQIDSVNQFRSVFFRGIISGLGGAVGATIIFAALVAGMSTILFQLGWFPEFNEFISRFMPGR